jgi:hypothetical protein
MASYEGSTPTEDASSDSWYQPPVQSRQGEGRKRGRKPAQCQRGSGIQGRPAPSMLADGDGLDRCGQTRKTNSHGHGQGSKQVANNPLQRKFIPVK